MPIGSHEYARAGGTSVANAVIAGLVAQIQGMRMAATDPPDVPSVASALLTTKRTLGRRLAAQGTSLGALLDQVLRSVATDLPAARALSVELIADKLGYADTSAFTHAFRRWTGQSPRAYRASMVQ